VVKLGVGAKVLIEFSTFGDRFLSVVADVKNDGRLLVYSPVSLPIIERLRTDQNVLVRFAHKGSLKGFRSRVLNQIESVHSLFELEKPIHTFDAEERSEPRCACHFPGSLVVEGERAALIVVEDMSAHSTRIRFLNGGLTPFLQDFSGLIVTLKFYPFNVDQGYAIDCRIKNLFIKDGIEYAVLDYEQDEFEMRSRIAQFIDSRLCCALARI